MKKTSILFLALLCSLAVSAQIKKPVTWKTGIKSLGNHTYEVHLLAVIDKGWHIYAQKQSPDAIAIPTTITFVSDPRITLIGKPIEVGKKDTYIVKEIGITNYEYAGKVDFVQKVKVKPDVKSIKGKVNWQVCTHEECLPEDSLDFTVQIP